MEIAISVIVGFMIIGALYAIHARDLLSAVIAGGIVGYSLVICFLLLRAPDLAIVQIVVETITLIIMVAVVLDSTREEEFIKTDKQGYFTAITGILIIVVLFYFMKTSVASLDPFGEGTLRMAHSYIEGATEKTGSANLVTGVVFDFRGYDTLGEATVLVTAVLGVLTIMRIKGKKEKI
jgi:multisubunit Na+/H+ antiporter MnhB subunit